MRITFSTSRLVLSMAALVLAAPASPLDGRSPGARELSFEERVAAQAAIERVHWRQRIWPEQNPGPKPPLEEVLPDTAIRSRVVDYLKKSVALEKDWDLPITHKQLQTEMNRMAAGTRQPGVLRELFAALGNDPFLIAECLARPILTDRLLRDLYARDERFHGELERRATEALSRHGTVEGMRHMDGEYREMTWKLGKGSPEEALGSSEEGDVLTLDAEQWAEMLRGLRARLRVDGELPLEAARLPIRELGPLREDDESFSTVAVLVEGEGYLKTATVQWRKQSFDVWWREKRLNLPARLTTAFLDSSFVLPLVADATDDTWAPTAWAPEARYAHTAVWTGTEMIVWGGTDGTVYYSSGGRYDPSTDSWTPTADLSAPQPRADHTAVWTGSIMIVWGGYDGTTYFNTGARYNPSTDTWTATSTGAGVPSGRSDHTAVWAGSVMIVWGGHGAVSDTFSGGRYNPSGNNWTATSTGANVPGVRSSHTAVWTGSAMIVWGGYDGFEQQALDDGGRYNPSTDTWSPMTTLGAPSARLDHTAVWTGSVMVVWGGRDGTPRFNTGGRYNPSMDTWTATSTAIGVPGSRSDHTAEWTGSEMIVWGGEVISGDPPRLQRLSTGGRYNPSTNNWTATTTAGAPSVRSQHTAAWTGSEMIVWGGIGPFNTGGRYDSSTDSWTPTSTVGNPTGRRDHTAVWTGSEMIVWGGQTGSPTQIYLNSGGQYTPSTDSWTPTSTGANVPAARALHTTVWTGSEMIVWGGSGAGDLNTGGRYNPATDTWAATRTPAPLGRSSHSALWTGAEMIVWGGYSGTFGYLSAGARYDPSTDTWSFPSTVDAPSARRYHTAVWTGIEMIVWGGRDGSSSLNTGGRYSPSTDTWAATSTGANVPSARFFHTVIWTGSEMIVWGGDAPSQVNTGARYNPSNDTWTPTSVGAGLPTARAQHTAVWTGSEMIVWGGTIFAGHVNSGGRYHPGTDSWAPTSTTGAPSARADHAAVWTGSEMIVWGGWRGSPAFGTGGRYVRIGVVGPPFVILTAVDPPNYAEGVSVGTNVTITFSEAMDAATLTESIHLLSPGAVPVDASVAVGPLCRTVTLDPTASLDPDTFYTVEVTASARDLSGDAAMPFTSTFRTAAPSTGGRPLPTTGGQTKPPPAAAQAKEGSSVAATGDLDGDGLSDFIAGAPGYQVGANAEAGGAVVYLGNAAASELSSPDIIFTGEAAHDRAGLTVAGNFDFNRDGFPDILIGAEQVDRTGGGQGVAVGTGKAYLIYFDPADSVHYPNLGDPAVSDTVSLSLVGQPGGLPGVVFTGVSLGDQAGFAVAGGGRVDPGAGQDILIGAPGADPLAKTDAGVVYLVFDDASLSGTVSLGRVANGQGDEVRGIVYRGDAAGDLLGYAVAFPGDVMGTFGDDIAMGAPLADSSGSLPNAGIVYVAQGGTLGRGIIDIDLIGGAGSVAIGTQLQGDQSDGHLGSSVAGGGDNQVDVDRDADLLMGAPLYDVPSFTRGGPLSNAGAVFQTARRLGRGIIDIDLIGSSAAGGMDGAIWTGSSAEDQLGYAVAGLGDVTGDPYDDIALGAPFADPSGVAGAGALYLIRGATHANARRGTLSVGTVGSMTAGDVFVGSLEEANENAGYSCAGTGDLDGSGTGDFVVGAPGRDAAVEAIEVDAGTVYIVTLDDTDGDGRVDRSDCDAADLEVWDLPLEVQGLTLAHDSGTGVTTLTWAEPQPRGGVPGSIRYDTIRAPSPAGFTSGGAVCVESDDSSDTMATNGAAPAPGVSFYYLVRAENSCGPGVAGTDSSGTPRPARSCP